jgi:hypothetical protein
MSILNNASKGSHLPTLCLVDRLLNRSSMKSKDYISIDSIIQNYSPDQLFISDVVIDGDFKVEQNPKKKLKETLEFWCDYPLWDVSSEGIRSKSPLNSDSDLPQRIFKSIFNEKRDILKGNSVEPLIRSMCQLLALEENVLLGGNSITSSGVAESINSYFPKYLGDDEIRLSVNSADVAGLVPYGLFLGLLESTSSSESVVDPTRAIRGFLNDIYLDGEKSLRIQEFIKRLNLHLPIFDGSENRKKIESLMVEYQTNKIKFTPKKGNEISASLGFALYRLSVEGLIYLEAASDADYRMQFELPKVGTVYVSDIRLVENK